MQLKEAGFLTKLVVITLLIIASVTFLQLQGQIASAQEERDALQLQVARQVQRNADLQDAVEHSGDPDRQEDVARNELGLVSPGEKVIYFTD